MQTSTPTALTRIDPHAPQLVAEGRDRTGGRLSHKEIAVECLFGGSFVAVATLMAATMDWNRSLSVTALVLSIVAFLAACSVNFEIGDGFAVPTQVVFVATLFVLPVPLVPAVVAVAGVLYRAGEGWKRGAHPSRALQAPADSWYAIGPALVLAFAAAAEPDWSHWPIFLAALAAQFALDALYSTSRAASASGVPPRTMLAVLGWVYGVDAALAPLGLITGFVAYDRPYLILLVLPLLAVLSHFAHERKTRIDHALELSGAYRGTAMLLGQVVESDDAYTGEHSRGVVELSVAVADRLGLDARTRVRVEFGALLHDVGKIAVPNEIINKAGPLDEDEWAIMRRHTIEGEEMLKPIGGLLADVGRVVRSSHEHYNGAGYPDGLAGEAIPIEARIVCCCDAFSAMTTDRSYREAMPLETALLELQACAGTQFDPQVAAALAAIVAESA